MSPTYPQTEPGAYGNVPSGMKEPERTLAVQAAEIVKRIEACHQILNSLDGPQLDNSAKDVGPKSLTANLNDAEDGINRLVEQARVIVARIGAL